MIDRILVEEFIAKEFQLIGQFYIGGCIYWGMKKIVSALRNRE